MAKSGTWGGELEMSILSKLNKWRFQLYISDGSVLVVDNTGTSEDDEDSSELEIDLTEDNISMQAPPAEIRPPAE